MFLLTHCEHSGILKEMSFILLLLLFLGTFPAIKLDDEYPQETCNTTNENLYIVVDSSSEIALTFTRIKHFLQYFIARRDNSSQSTILVIETFQKKFWSISNISSLKEIFVQLGQFKETMRLNISNDNTMSTLNKSVSYVEDVLNTLYYTYTDEQQKSFVIAWFAVCIGNCKSTIRFFEDYTLKNLRKLILFVKTSKRFCYPTDYSKLIEVHLFSNDNLSEYDVVSICLCKQCRPDWNKKTTENDPSIFNCYKGFISPFQLNWYDASKHCKTIYSDLPVIETFYELTLFTTTLKETIYKTFPEPLENVIIHVGLTKLKYGHDNFLWTNKRPFLLRKNIDYKNELHNCVVLKYSMENESIGENYKISWETTDCNKKITNIVMCETFFEREKYKISQSYDPSSSKFKKPSWLFKEGNNSMGLFARNDYVIDEINVVEYKTMMFKCEDRLYTIIPYTGVCDREVECENNRDEAKCPYNVVFWRDEFLCINPNANDRFPVRQKYSAEGKCDAHQDCPDNSDEEGCDECMGRRCSDGTCVPRHWLSRDGDKCIVKKKHNGKMFIDSIGDLFIVPTEFEVVTCTRTEVTNLTNKTITYSWAPKCIYLRGRSGRPAGCDDLSHLHDCVDFACSEEFVKCHQSFCIPLYYIHDDTRDCPHGEDEIGNIKSTVHCLYVCEGAILTCFHYVNICDGIVDCPYGDDELNCNLTCPLGFKCFRGATVVSNIANVTEVNSFRIFHITTKYLNLNGLDLSQLNETFILPRLVELHASNCNLVSLEYVFVKKFKMILFTLDLSYNKFTEISLGDKNIQFFELSFLNLTGNYELSLLHGSLDKTNMDISYTNLTSLDVKYYGTNVLRYLNISNTKIESLGNLNQIKSIEILDIRNTMHSENYTVNFLNKVPIKSALYIDNSKYCCPQVIGESLPREKCHAPFDSISSCEDLIGDIFKRSLVIIVATFSLVGNIVVLSFRTYYNREILKKGYGVFVTNLGISDFVMGVYLTIIVCADFYFRGNYVLYETNWRVSNFCKISGFFSTLSSETSTFFILLITLDRFLVIRFPFGQYRLTKNLIFILVVAVWFVGFVLAMIPIVFSEWTVYSSNGMCLGLPLTTDQQHGWQYSVGIFIVLNFILFLFISFGQVLIFFSMNNQRMTGDSIRSSRREQEIDIAKQLFIVAMSNFLCWFPICVIGLMSINGHKVSPDTYAWFVIFVLPLNAALNPLIYTIPAMYKNWRKFKMS